MKERHSRETTLRLQGLRKRRLVPQGVDTEIFSSPRDLTSSTQEYNARASQGPEERKRRKLAPRIGKPEIPFKEV